VEPIVLLDRNELLPRAEAAAELGLDPGGTNVLVSLGQGEEVKEATAGALAHLAGRDGVRVAALSSALAAVGSVPDGVVQLRATYPMSRYFAAFDAAVAAAGYNAYHELIELGVPSLFVPMRRETDDQPARARYADAAGLGLGVGGPTDRALVAQLDRLLNPVEREAIAGRLAMREPAGGAAQAAAWLAELASYGSIRPETRQSAPRDPGREFRRRWGSFFASAPRTAVRLGRQQLTKPRARAHVLAIGIDADDVVDAVRGAIAEAGEKPERTLVVTDALAKLGDLRALGAGVEHVPARDSREAELAEIPYERFLESRLGLIRAERPKPRRVAVAPGSAPVP
jgi:hypothetical protein